MKRSVAVVAVLLGLLWAQPASAAYSYICSGKYHSGTANGVSGIGPVDFGCSGTGVPDLVVVVMVYQGGSAPGFNDTAGGSNTWTQKAPSCSLASVGSYLTTFYAYGTIASYSSDTLATAGSNIFADFVWVSWSGARTSSDPFVQQNCAVKDNVPGSTTVTSGSLSTTSGNLMVSGLNPVSGDAAAAAVDSSYTFRQGTTISTSYGGAIATFVSTGGSLNPGWTFTSTSYAEAQHLEFAVSGGAAPTTHPCGNLLLLGVGCEAPF